MAICLRPSRMVKYTVSRLGLDNGRLCTIFISAADEGLTLRTWTNHSESGHSDAVLGPLLQPLQLHVLYSGGHGRLLRGLHVISATFCWAHHLVVHLIPRQGPILTSQRWGLPTYQQGGRAGAGALNVLRGG